MPSWEGVGNRLFSLYELQCLHVTVSFSTYMQREMLWGFLPYMPWIYIYIKLSSQGPSMWSFNALGMFPGMYLIWSSYLSFVSTQSFRLLIFSDDAIRPTLVPTIPAQFAASHLGTCRFGIILSCQFSSFNLSWTHLS